MSKIYRLPLSRKDRLVSFMNANWGSEHPLINNPVFFEYYYVDGDMTNFYVLEENGEIIVRPDNYYDKNGKRTATEKELLEYIKNVYYVLLTRGIKGTYLYVCDDALREYIKKYVETEKAE